jgi:hypothetical protein
MCGLLEFDIKIPCDTPPNPSQNSNVSSKMKTTKEERVGMCPLAHNILGVRGVCWNYMIKTRKNEK